MPLTLAQIEEGSRAADARARLSQHLVNGAWALGLGPSLSRAVRLNLSRQQTARTRREMLHDARTAEGLCYRCGEDRVSFWGLCRDCVEDYAD